MTRRRLWIERDYKSFMRSKQGRKLIDIFRILGKNIANIEDIGIETGLSRSEIRNLLILAEKSDLVLRLAITKMSRSPGTPSDLARFLSKSEKNTGRRPLFYVLTPRSLFIMRSDLELSGIWKSVEETYQKVYTPNILDSYNNLKYAIQKHPVLGKFEKPYYFDGELQRTLLNPFLFKRGLDEEQVNKLSDELVKLINENVRPQHIRNYVSTLQDSVVRLEKTIQRHELLIEKIKSLKH